MLRSSMVSSAVSPKIKWWKSEQGLEEAGALLEDRTRLEQKQSLGGWVSHYLLLGCVDYLCEADVIGPYHHFWS